MWQIVNENHNKIKQTIMFCEGKCSNRNRSKSLRRRREFMDNEESDFHQPTPTKKLHGPCEEQISGRQGRFYDDIQECPTIQLTKEDMKKDPTLLLLELEKKYPEYGAVKLVACESWNPPLTLRYIDKGITTRIQVLQQLSQGKPFEQKIEAYSLKAFENFALNFEKKYSYKTHPKGKTALSKDEYQFWSLVTKPEYKDYRVQVEYAADLPALKYGSGFPTTTQSGCRDADFEYHTNLYNLNNTYKGQESLLKISGLRNEKISGVTTPWVYIGMKFSSFCWHVEDLYINSINYNHKGSAKIWYIIPGCDKEKFDDFVKTKFSKTMSFKPDFMHRITLMIDPLDIKAAGIKVYKINHSARSFVFTFPKVYHAGFSTGLNMGEAINFLSINNLASMKEAYKEYESYNGKKVAIFPYEWIICENYLNREKFSISAQQKEAVDREFKEVLRLELDRIRKTLEGCDVTQYTYIPHKQLKYDKNMCSVCKNYCYLSFLKCIDCGKLFCLTHVTGCCSDQYRLYVREPTKEGEELLKLLAKYPKIDQKQPQAALTQA